MNLRVTVNPIEICVFDGDDLKVAVAETPPTLRRSPQHLRPIHWRSLRPCRVLYAISGEASSDGGNKPCLSSSAGREESQGLEQILPGSGSTRTNSEGLGPRTILRRMNRWHPSLPRQERKVQADWLSDSYRNRGSLKSRHIQPTCRSSDEQQNLWARR